MWLSLVFYNSNIQVLTKLVTGYAYGCEDDTLAPSLRNFYRKFGNESKAELSFREAWHAKQILNFEGK